MILNLDIMDLATTTTGSHIIHLLYVIVMEKNSNLFVPFLDTLMKTNVFYLVLNKFSNLKDHVYPLVIVQNNIDQFVVSMD